MIDRDKKRFIWCLLEVHRSTPPPNQTIYLYRYISRWMKWQKYLYKLLFLLFIDKREKKKKKRDQVYWDIIALMISMKYIHVRSSIDVTSYYKVLIKKTKINKTKIQKRNIIWNHKIILLFLSFYISFKSLMHFHLNYTSDILCFPLNCSSRMAASHTREKK